MLIHIFIMQKVESTHSEYLISRFCVVGTSFHKAATSERSLFAITPQQQESLLTEARQQGFRSIFLLSTCNRTELYGYCENDNSMTDLLINHSQSSQQLFNRHGSVRRGRAAIDHLFKVATGLDSQITGDYEIAGQLKAAVATSRTHQLIGPLMDRTISYALQASKAVKSSTLISQGTVSVSYAVIQWLQQHQHTGNESVLIVGAGSLARSVARNIQHYLPATAVTIINRNAEKAQQLAAETGYSFAPFHTLSQKAAGADIIILCTHAAEYILHAKNFTPHKPVQIVDLSMPQNADPALGQLLHVKLAGVDEVSRCLDSTLATRHQEIPKAIKILDEHIEHFYEWLALYKHVPLINDMKSKLFALGQSQQVTDMDLPATDVNRLVNKTVGALAMNLRDRKEQGCQYITAINDFLNHGQYE